MKRTFDLYDLFLFTLVIAFGFGALVAPTDLVRLALLLVVVLSAALFWSGRRRQGEQMIDVALRVVVTIIILALGIVAVGALFAL